MLFNVVENSEFFGNHIEIILFIEMEKNRINYRPYWNYAIFRDEKNRINRRYIGIMLFIEIPKLELMAAILKLCYL